MEVVSARGHQRSVFFRVLAGEGVMAYETKTIAELEELATNLRLEIALHPDYELERVELKECESWIELRRRELDANLRHSRTAA
jgi:hypothetical protein